MPFPIPFFKRPANKQELKGKKAPTPELPYGEVSVVCPKCSKSFFSTDLKESCFVCPKCGYHLRAGARARLLHLADNKSFSELFTEYISINRIDFEDYDNKLNRAIKLSGENEAVICGTLRIEGLEAVVFAMEPNFMMGSMGTIVGEKITKCFEYALERRLPVIGFTVSGGARMQEGILSLMQMAKTAAAIRKFSDEGLFYTVILCDPTTGGVTASFAMLADIIIAEPGALIGFAGPRVIEQTIRQNLPSGFQSAEFLLEKGFVDRIEPRKNHKTVLARFLKMHTGGTKNE